MKDMSIKAKLDVISDINDFVFHIDNKTQLICVATDKFEKLEGLCLTQHFIASLDAQGIQTTAAMLKDIGVALGIKQKASHKE